MAKAGEGLGITVKAIARGHEGRSVPAAVCWVVEGFFRLGERLNTMFEDSEDHLVALVTIAFISILARHPKRLEPEDLSA